MEKRIQDNNLQDWCKKNNPKLLEEWNYEKNGKRPVEYAPKSGKKVWWKCKEGHEWDAIIISRTSSGNNCPYCSGRYAIQGENDLVTWCKEYKPELLSEWDYSKNKKHPSTYMPKSGIKVWWKCKKGHEWKTSINSRNGRNDGCPYCTNKYVLKGYNDLHTKYPAIAQEWNYKKNKGIAPIEVMCTGSKKVWWKCKEGHEWQTRIYLRTINGYGCPYCAGQMAILGKNDLLTWCKANNPELLAEWDYKKNDAKPSDYTPKSGKKVWWKCKEGHEWETKVCSRTNTTGGCPYCSGRMAISGKNDLKTVFPSIALEWNYERNKKNLDEILPRAGAKVWWKCNKGHEWQATVYNRTIIKSGCPYCSGRYAIAGENDLETLYPEIVNEWDYEKNNNKPSVFTPYSNKKVWWKCAKGHEWKTTICGRTGKGNRCPICVKNTRV